MGSWVCVALVYFGPNWILWAVLVRVLGRRHPSTLDDEAVLRLALLQLGFQVTALAARVVWMSPPDAPPRARSHMLLKVELPPDSPRARQLFEQMKREVPFDPRAGVGK